MPKSFGQELIVPILKCDPKNNSCWGPKIWKARDALCDLIPCDNCRKHCHSMEKFEHDLINRQQGKPLHDAENVKDYLTKVVRSFPEVKLLR